MTGDEHWLAITNAERLHLLYGSDQFRRNSAEFDLRLCFEHRDQIVGSKPFAGILVESRAQVVDPFARQRESDRVGMAAKSGKEFVTAFQSCQQMKRRNRTPRAVPFSVFTTND